MYLIAFVEKIPIDKKIPEMVDLTPDYVITFNYTNTYETLYKKGEVYHIHGKTDVTRSAEENDMVLGMRKTRGQTLPYSKNFHSVFKNIREMMLTNI